MSKAKKHPPGLYFLFFSEMWERFGYYLMIGIFVLFMTDTHKGGLGLDRQKASDIFGTFIGLVFLTPFIGGLLADKLLGYRRSIIIGGVMMGIGYMTLAIPGDLAFFTALTLIIIGNGFFKPNISALLGNLYTPKEYSARKDAGYNIFYMGINLGGFICNFFAAYLRNNFGWGYAFFAAGIGMFIGIIVFISGLKHYKHAERIQAARPEDASIEKVFKYFLLPAGLCSVIGWIYPGNIFGSDSTDAFIFGSVPVLAFYITLMVKSKGAERKQLGALMAIFGVVILFWAVFKQNGTALTTWAEFYTDRTVPAYAEAPAKNLKMVQTVTTIPDSFAVYDAQFRALKNDDGKVAKALGLNPYLKNLPEKEFPAEGKSISLISTELFQSVNPFFVVVLTPLIVMLFSFLRRKNKEPSTPAKIAIGLVISAFSTLIMVLAVNMCLNGQIKCSPWWLVSAYGVMTVGELFLSPMGLSLVSKLSPPRLTSLMMGGWFLATSIGNKLSGILATMWDRYENKGNYFLVNFVLLAIAAISILFMLKWLSRVFKEHTKPTETSPSEEIYVEEVEMSQVI